MVGTSASKQKDFHAHVVLGALNEFSWLTSKAAKAKLLDVEENDPKFWAELTQCDKLNIATPGVVKGQPVPEDTEVGIRIDIE